VRSAFVIVGCAAVLAVAGCGGDDDEQPAQASPAAALADLTVTVDPDGDGPEKAKTAQVTCDAAEDSDVCGAVAKLKPEVFEPTGAMTACTQQFGGPETATVSGTLRGQDVDGTFSRENGCEISRWNDVSAVLEAAG
jgi:hypothetical protein